MAQPLVSDALWERIAPLLPPPKPRRPRHPVRRPLDRRKVLTGIIFVLKTGIPWEALPLEMGCGCGMTCWNYLHAWQEAGVWPALHDLFLMELQGADRIDWSRATIDSTHARALGGGENTGKNSDGSQQLGTMHHMLTDAQGVPLVVKATGSNVADVAELLPVVDSLAPVPGRAGRPRQRPQRLYADPAYDSARHRQELRRRDITPKIA